MEIEHKVKSHLPAHPTPQPLAYGVPEFCRAAGISRSAFFEAIREGKGPRVKRFGRRLLIPVNEAEAWLDNLPDREPAQVA